MKTIIKKSIAGALIGMCLFGLFGCGKNEDKGTPIEFSVSYEDEISSKEELNITELIKSKGELDNLCARLWFCSENLDPIHQQERALYEKLLGYNEDFFKERALMIYFLWESYYNGKTTINDIKTDNNCLKMILHQSASGVSAAAITQWVFIAEVKQEDVKDITEVKATIEYVKNK